MSTLIYPLGDDGDISYVTGVEYTSPSQHGGIFGTIYRRYYSIPDAVGVGQSVNVSLGFTISGRPISFGGWIRLASWRIYLAGLYKMIIGDKYES